MSPPFSACRAVQRVALAFAASVIAALPTLQAVTIQLVPPAENGPTSGVVRFDLLVLNDSVDVDPYRVPSSMPVRLTTPGGVVDATANLVPTPGIRAGELVRVPTGGFVRLPMAVTLTTEGRVTVELRGATTPTSLAATVVEVRSPGAAGLTSAIKASEPSTTQPITEPGITLRNPFSIVTQRDPNFRSESGLVEYLANRIRPHEPVYIVAGNEDPSTKFQLSFKYQIFDPNGPLSQKAPGLSGLHFAYSQTSFWDLGEDSSPFFDNSYRPEILVSYDDLDRYVLNRDGERALPDWFRFGLQAGYRHESNGRDGLESRSYNTLYIRPIFTFSRDDGWFVTIAPRVFTYIFDLDDNPDIREYRGYGDLRVVVGRGGGLQLAATGRMGEDWNNGALQLDLSFPIRQLSAGNLDVYFLTQYFTGYGESLLGYNERTSSLRFGLALVR